MAAAPSQVVITSSPLDLTASSSATGNVTYAVTDQFGNPATSSSPTTVQLSSTSSGGTFAATSGGSSVTSVTLAANQSAGSFSYGDTVAGSPTLGVSATGINSATQTETVTAASLSQVVITSSAFSMTASSSATQSFTVGLQDAYGNPATSSSPTTVTLSSSSATGVFASTSGGSSVTQATIPANTSSITLYYGDKTAGSPTITTSSPGFTSATQTETILAAAPSQVVLTSSPLDLTASSSATGNVTYAVTDPFGNPATSSSPTTVELSSTSPGGTFASTSGGSPVTSVTLPTNQSAGSFFYGDTATGAPTLTVSSPGLTSATQTEAVSANSPSRLVYIQQPSNSPFDGQALSPPVSVQVEDAYGNLAPVAGITVTVTPSSGSVTADSSAQTDGTGMATFAGITLSSGEPRR